MLSLNPEAVEFVPTPIIASSDDYDQYDPWYNPVPYAQQKFGGKKKKKKHAKQKRAELSGSISHNNMTIPISPRTVLLTVSQLLKQVLRC